MGGMNSRIAQNKILVSRVDRRANVFSLLVGFNCFFFFVFVLFWLHFSIHAILTIVVVQTICQEKNLVPMPMLDTTVLDKKKKCAYSVYFGHG